MICLNPEILTKLTSRGVLAYVAVSIAGDNILSTASLAALVRAQTSVMLEGLKELSSEYPEKVRLEKRGRWACGIGGGGGGPILGIDVSLRFRDLIDDLKKYWDYLNPTIAFSFSGGDGHAVRAFLSDHPTWTRKMWQDALNYRAQSVKNFGNASRTERLVGWVRRLGDYAGGPLNQFNKPVEGSGNAGKAIANELANSQAVAAYLSAGRA